MVDPQGRPYFLWDLEMDLEEFKGKLVNPDPDVRAYFIGKLMRQAKPDDVFQFVGAGDILALWPRVKVYLGRTLDFWTWLFDRDERL